MLLEARPDPHPPLPTAVAFFSHLVSLQPHATACVSHPLAPAAL